MTTEPETAGASPDPAKPREPSSASLAALGIMAAADSRRLHRNDFNLRMSQIGFGAGPAESALRALQKRLWVTIEGTQFVLTDAGVAASTQTGLSKPRAREKRLKKPRMPHGLF